MAKYPLSIITGLKKTFKSQLNQSKYPFFPVQKLQTLVPNIKSQFNPTFWHKPILKYHNISI